MYIDSHAHLDGPKFDTDRDQVLVRAREAGLERILAIGSGTGPGTLDCAIKVASHHDWIYATIGIHPHEAKLATEADYAEMQQLAGNPKVVAWGEIGLDYFYDHSPREVQKEVFRLQMELARAARLPIIIHCRPTNNSENAWDDTFRCCATTGRPPGCRASCTALPESGSTPKPHWISASIFPLLETSASPKRKTFAKRRSKYRWNAC